MGKIANILGTHKGGLEKSQEAELVLKASNVELDREDLEAAINHGNLGLINAVVKGLNMQVPKVEIPEKIITQAIGKFDYQIQYEYLAMKELVGAVIDSGAKVTHEVLQKILNSSTTFKTQMFDEIFDAMQKSKTVTHEAVEFIFNHLNTHHEKHIADKKKQALDAYLNSGGKIDAKMIALADKNGIKIEQKK